MNTRCQQDEHIVEQAAEWVAALPSMTATKQAALAEWLMESPRHLEEFFLMSAMSIGLDGIDAEREFDVHEGLEAFRSNVFPLEGPHMQAATPARLENRPKSSRRWPAAAAAFTAVAIGAGWAAVTYTQWYGYSTVIGEIRSFELADGSVIHLNTLSRVKVHLNADQRELELVAGEAVFKVAHDAGRPFRVHSGNAVIQALGTQFNVNRHHETTTVSVIEGAVGISIDGKLTNEGEPATSARPYTHLEAGKETSITAAGNLTPVVLMNPPKVTAWQQRRLLFKDDTLADIAAEFNRYNRKPQIRLADDEVAGKKLSGVFDADAPESLLSFLQRNDDLSFERTENEVVIGARRP